MQNKKNSKKTFLKLFLLLAVFGVGGFAFSAEVRAVVMSECNDGLDNDGVGGIDLADADCVNVNDDHEGNNPTTFFRQHSVWTQSLPANLSIIPNSATMVNELGASSSNGFIVSGDTWNGYGGFMYWEVKGTQGVDWDYVNIDVSQNTSGPFSQLQATHTIDGGPPHSHPTGMQRDAMIEHGWNINVPMPIGAVPGGNKDICANGYAYHDSPMVIIGPDGETMWDMYNLSHCASPGLSGGEANRMNPESGYWSAKVVRRFSKNSDGLNIEPTVDHPWGWIDFHGTTGSALNSYIPGVLTVDEIVNRDSINHALRMLGSGNKCNINHNQPYPASSNVYDACNGDEEIVSIPYGQLFQLDPSYDCSRYSDARYSPGTHHNFYLKICEAMKKYGIYYVDSSEHVPWLIIPIENTYWDNTKSWSDIAVLDGTLKLDRNMVASLRALDEPTPDTWTNTTQCSDGINNDADGRIDYPADPGCTSAYGDDSEAGDSDTTPPAVPTGVSVQ
jgi:hypothetical protein